MSSFVIFLCYIYLCRLLSLAVKFSILLISLLEFLILICFLSRNLILFYISFECIIFPMVVLILVYGSRGRKSYAMQSFFMYTFVGSIFLIIGIIYLYSLTSNLNFDILLHCDLSSLQTQHPESSLIFLFLIFWVGLSIKLPTMPVHLWLPEAHVEAPTVGSVILAAILLKLGGYGLIRIVLPLTHTTSFSVRIIPLLFCLISVLYGSFLAYRHFDIKKIIAYSSIVHINFATVSLLMESKIGLLGCILSMLSHSIISSALFFIAGFFYEKLKTRNLLFYSSLYNRFNYIYAIVFFFVLSNMALPISIAFIGETLVLCGSQISLFSVFFLLILSLFFSGLFSFALLYRLIYFNRTMNLKVVRFSIINDVYVSPFNVNVLLTFTSSELFILSTLLFVTFALFFNLDLVFNLCSNFVFLL